MSAPFLAIAAWTNHSGTTRYPSTCTYDLAGEKYLAGVIGLNPAGTPSRGVVTFYWTTDAAGDNIVGTQGMHVSSSIPSMAELRMLNRGPYLHFTYEAFVGPNPLAANLFTTNNGGNQPLLCGDTILIDEQDATLAANTSVPIYPDDYFAGEGRLYLSAPANVKVTIHGVDLTDQFWPLDCVSPGSYTTVFPIGTWLAVVSNSNGSAITYTLAVTPLFA